MPIARQDQTKVQLMSECPHPARKRRVTVSVEFGPHRERLMIEVVVENELNEDAIREWAMRELKISQGGLLRSRDARHLPDRRLARWAT
jgi:hypothetical protein